MLLESITLFLIAGLLAGFLAGFVGSGGGIISVPILAFIFQMQAYPSHLVMHTAIGTSLAVMIVSTAFSVYAHPKDHYNKRLLKIMLPGIALGALLGAWIAHLMPDHMLHLLFIILIIISALKVSSSLYKKFTAHGKNKERIPNNSIVSICAIIIGSIATMLGIGGSVMTIPLFTQWRIEMHNTVATAAACTIPIAIVGSVSFLLLGLIHTDTQQYCFGYINVLAFVFMSAISWYGAILGSTWCERIPQRPIKYFYLVLLILIIVSMILQR